MNYICAILFKGNRLMIIGDYFICIAHALSCRLIDAYINAATSKSVMKTQQTFHLGLPRKRINTIIN
jgi:hypothetical protein